jgi:hypothetical protein
MYTPTKTPDKNKTSLVILFIINKLELNLLIIFLSTGSKTNNK